MHDDILAHYGTKRHSGRYPWGSGKDPDGFLGFVKELTDSGMSESEVATAMGITTTELRAQKSNMKAAQKSARYAMAVKLQEKGYSKTAIGERMGVDESYVRRLLAEKRSIDGTSVANYKATKLENTATMLRESVKDKKYIDIGAGVDSHLGISSTVLGNAVTKLKNEEGYQVMYLQVEQLGTGNKTSLKVLCAPGTTWKEVNDNKHKIGLINSYSEDLGRTWLGIEPVKYVSKDRVHIRYAEEGGIEKDGLIEIRRGPDDISIGKSRYAQCRIAVEGDSYMKGMVAYSDDLPPGKDFVFNTNKKKGTPMEDVLKPMKRLTNEDGSDAGVDQDNPFGATVRQRHYKDKNGKDQLSPMNIVNEEGDWAKWSKNLPSQMLSKQSTELAEKQLGLEYEKKRKEFDDINALTNPVIKEKMLQEFSDGVDSSAVHLKAHAMPRQATHVIMPFPDIKPTEVYAPNYKDGEKVVLIRFPHAGQFEIPELTVNNKYASAKKMLGTDAKDAIGINAIVAEKLSGADFDGDTTLVIPNNKREIKHTESLKRLDGFDPKALYQDKTLPKMSDKNKGLEMGGISNLITDMSAKKAPLSEIAEAVRHSMVVIDAQKHSLNYKQSAIDHNIAALKIKYQGGANRGASTLISRSTSDVRVDQYKDGGIDPKTGAKIKIRPGDTYIDKRTGKKMVYEGETYTNSKGETVYKQVKSKKLAEVDDAFELSSGSPMETVYANHANRLKALANEARKEMVAQVPTPYSPQAKKAYASEVESLNAKLKVALANAPRERQALMLANHIVNTKKESKPDMDNAELKRLKGQALTEARFRTGASKTKVEITDNEWNAIQAGAISTNKLKQILANADPDRIKELATPRNKETISAAKETKIRLLLAKGVSTADVAEAVGVSISTINSLR